MQDTESLQKYQELSHDLQAIAERIRERVVKAAYEIGIDLLQAKSLCSHGEWLPFLEAAGQSERNAQLMMQYATKRDDPKYEIISDLPKTRFLIEARKIDNPEPSSPNVLAPEWRATPEELATSSAKQKARTIEQYPRGKTIRDPLDEAESKATTDGKRAQKDARLRAEERTQEIIAEHEQRLAVDDTYAEQHDRIVSLVEQNHELLEELKLARKAVEDAEASAAHWMEYASSLKKGLVA